MGVARRRLGRDGFKEFLGIVVSASIGAFKVTDGQQASRPTRLTFCRASWVRARPAQGSRSAIAVVSVTGRAVAENLEAMAQFLPLIVSSILARQPHPRAELASARDEFAFLFKAFLSVRENEGRIAPGSTPDIKLVRQIFSNLRETEQAALLLIWLAVRNIPGWRENLEVLRQGVLTIPERESNGTAECQASVPLTIRNGPTALGIGMRGDRPRRTRG